MRRYGLIALAILLLTGTSAFGQEPDHAPCSAEMMPTPECAVIHAAAFAQADDMPPPLAPDAPGPRRRHLEQFRMLKLLELLDLKQDQEMEFLVEFKALREKQLALQQERERMVRSLADGLRGDSLADAEITRSVQRIMKLRREHELANERFLDEVRDILTPEQLGRMVVFEERFEHELLDQVRSFRERRGMPGPGHGRRQQDSD